MLMNQHAGDRDDAADTWVALVAFWQALAPEALTACEREVARLLVCGESTGAIAEALGITHSTVAGHLRRMHAQFTGRYPPFSAFRLSDSWEAG
jgi:DNA-binding NarL/FixJ family response regulator